MGWKHSICTYAQSVIGQHRTDIRSQSRGRLDEYREEKEEWKKGKHTNHNVMRDAASKMDSVGGEKVQK